MKPYLKFMTFFILATLFIICAASYVVDPYGIYSHQTNLFPRKVAAADKGRTVKPYQASDAKPYTVLIGNSRIEIGMPVAHAFYLDKPVFNMGLPGANVALQYDYARHVVEKSDTVRQVVIALDFLDFTSDIDTTAPSSIDKHQWSWRLQGLTSDTLTDKRQYLAERISLLFSLSAISDTVSTVVNQHRNINALDINGFNDGRLYHFHVKNEGYGALYQQKRNELETRLRTKPQTFHLQSYQITELLQFIEQLKQRNIAIYLIINPYQEPYLNILQQFNFNDAFLAWKATMHQIAQKHDLLLFDFAIESEPVLSVVSAQSTDINDSEYFWEPAHYKTLFGEQILDALRSEACHELCKLLK